MTSPKRSRQSQTAIGHQGRHRRKSKTNDGFARRIGVILALSPVVLGAAASLQAPPSVFDDGTLLTITRFVSDGYLPYRDIWTLYGPGSSVLGAITTPLFGPGALALGIVQVVTGGFLVLGVYLLSRRYVNRIIAAVFAAAVGTVATSPHHFTQSLTLLIWGLWFIISSDDSKKASKWKLPIGAALIGSSFLGRYELAVVAPILIVGLWWFLRPTLEPPARRRILIAGLLPPALFAIYLIGIVGWEKTFFNLVDYPLHLYNQPYCRGLPTPWREAFIGLFAPLQGKLWNAHDIILGAGTYLPPAIGTLTFLSGWRRRRVPTPEICTIMLVGALTWLIWIEMRPRAGSSPEPTWPMMLTGSAILLSRLRTNRPNWARGFSVVFASIIIVTLLAAWVPGKLLAWKHWPPYHPLFAFANLDAEGLYNERIWEEVTRTVHQYAGPHERIFVALSDNRGHIANAPIFYWYVGRGPASRFIEFDPCLTDTEPVQREIVRDLETTHVVVTTTFFPQAPPPFGPPSSVLDDYLRANFHTVFEERLPAHEPGAFMQAFAVLVRQGLQPSTPE